MSELVESFVDFQVSEDCPEVGSSKVKSSKADCSKAGGPEDEPASEVTHKLSILKKPKMVHKIKTQPRKSFKYKDSHP